MKVEHLIETMQINGSVLENGTLRNHFSVQPKKARVAVLISYQGGQGMGLFLSNCKNVGGSVKNYYCFCFVSSFESFLFRFHKVLSYDMYLCLPYFTLYDNP